MGDAGDDGVDHVGMGEEDLLHVAGHDVVPAPDDDVLGPAGDPEETVDVEVAEVAGVEPPIPPGRLGGIGVPVVLRGGAGPRTVISPTSPALASAPSSSTIRISTPARGRPTEPRWRPRSPEGVRDTAPNSVMP